MKKVLALLSAIIVLAVLLRFFQLGKTPIALEWDEVALGYDAYSILKTGRDQFATFLPNNFRSLDDWKPPLYVYSAVPPVFLFGLTDFAVRFPSAFYGVLGVLLTYFLVNELFINKSKNERQSIALLSAVFLAISPWHLQFSRAAFETNLSVTVTIAAVLTFLWGIRKNPKFILLSSFFFGLSLFSYHSTRVVTPLLLISLLILLRKKLFTPRIPTKSGEVGPAKKYLWGFAVIYTVFWLFFLPIATNRDAQIRFLVTNDLQIEENQSRASLELLKDAPLGEDQLLAGKIFHNRRFSIYTYENIIRISRNYLSHFSPKFLVVEGDAPLHHAPGAGMAYFFDYPLIFFGLFVYMLKYRLRWNFILPLWLLIAPLPAAVTWQAPHSVRGEIILPTLQVFAAIGLWQIFYLLKKEWQVLALSGAVVFSAIFTYSAGRYLHQYYLHTNLELSRNWLYGRKEAVVFTEAVKKNYDRVLVSLNVDMPYIFWLYYSQYPPQKYLREGGTVSGGFADERNKFDKYEFRNFNFRELKGRGNLLLVSVPKDFPPDAKIIKRINYLDGSPALIIAENK